MPLLYNEVADRKQGTREMGITGNKGPWLALNQECGGYVACAVTIWLRGATLESKF